MVDFSNLRKLAVSAQDTAEYTFYEIEGEPTLKVRPATEANGRYWSAVLARSSKNVRRARSGKITASMLKEGRTDDRELYPKHVVMAWTTAPMDTNGDAVDFTAENCAAFLEAIPDHIFDGLRNFCSDVTNFQEDVMDEEEIEETGKN